MLKPPAFWQGHPSHPAALALAPLGNAYSWTAARRQARVTPRRARVPVLCGGSATLGGVGKTPFAMLIAARMQAQGRAVHVLTRGYGGSERGPLLVGPDATAEEVGDEALLLRRVAPVWVGADRAEAALAATDAGA